MPDVVILNDANINQKEVDLLWNEVEPICNDIWNLVGHTWGNFELLWNGECVPSEGMSINVAVPDNYLDAYAQAVSKVDDKSKKKIIKLILYLKGERFVDEKEVDVNKYTVTSTDVHLLLQLRDMKQRQRQMEVTDVKVNMIN
jgi:hypothetical protein